MIILCASKACLFLICKWKHWLFFPCWWSCSSYIGLNENETLQPFHHNPPHITCLHITLQKLHKNPNLWIRLLPLDKSPTPRLSVCLILRSYKQRGELPIQNEVLITKWVTYMHSQIAKYILMEEQHDTWCAVGSIFFT